MSFTEPMVVTDPDGSTTRVSGLDDSIRQFKRAFQERVESFFVDMNAQPWTVKNGATLGNINTGTISSGAVTSSGVVTSTGVTTIGTLGAGAINAASDATIGWTARTVLASTADGTLQLTNRAGVSFTSLYFGAAGDPSVPMLHVTGTVLETKLADNSAYSNHRMARLVATSIDLSGFVGNAKIIGGTTGVSHRDKTDTVDNLLITDAGNVTVRANLIITSGVIDLTGSGAVQTHVIMPTGGFTIFDHTNSFTNFQVSDSGNASCLGAFNSLSIGFNTTGVYKQGNVQVVGAQKAGWTAATGTPTRTTFATSTVTLPILAEHVKALIDDLIASTGHGLIGP